MADQMVGKGILRTMWSEHHVTTEALKEFTTRTVLRTSNQDDQKMSILQEHIRLLLDYPAMKHKVLKE